MSQPFTNNVPEVDFHGANGNVILGGDSIAADRYTEARLAPVAEKYILAGVDEDEVDMIWNFSEDEKWPSVLPSVFPRLLVNGSQGIGVSIANSWACHNLQETCKMLIGYIELGMVDNGHYYPDFPCGATIINKNDLPQINTTGKGRVIVEAKYEIVDNEIHFTEFPFQVYIEPLLEEIKSAIENDKVHNVTDVYNKSDKKRILLTVTCSGPDKVGDVLAELFAATSLRSQFNVNQVAIVGKTPKLLTLQDMCEIYVSHNISCIKRGYQFKLAKTEDRIEVLEGLAKALGDIDDIIKTIKTSDSAAEAKEAIMSCGFSERQADAILSMRLSKLSHLETDDVLFELQEKRELAAELRVVVESEDEQKSVLVNKLRSLSDEFGSPRRTVLTQRDIVKPQTQKAARGPEPVVVCYDANGYVKSVPEAKFRAAKGNLGRLETTTEGYIQIYTSDKVYRVKADSIKQCLATDKGTALGTILGTGVVDVKMMVRCGDNKDVIALAESGRIKRFNTSMFDGSTQSIKGQDYFPKNDVAFMFEHEKQYLTINTVHGYELCINTDSIKTSGKTSTGRVGIKLGTDDTLSAYGETSEPTEFLASIGTKGHNSR